MLQWDRLDHLTREVEAAVLDIATADLRTGAPLYVDVVVKTAYSTDPACLRARVELRRRLPLASDAGILMERLALFLSPLRMGAARVRRLCPLSACWEPAARRRKMAAPTGVGQLGCGRSVAPCFSWATLS